METQRKVKVIATSYLVDGDRNYQPGDEIKEGTLFDQADEYEEKNKVKIEIVRQANDKLKEAATETNSSGKGIKKLETEEAKLAEEALKEVAKAQKKTKDAKKSGKGAE